MLLVTVSAATKDLNGNTSYWYISAQRVRFGAGFDRGAVLVHTKGQGGSFWYMAEGRFGTH